MNRQLPLFAILPAAGHSRRMGTPKLLLPLGDRTVIGRLLRVLNHPGITGRIVVCRKEDPALRDEVLLEGATPVQPEIDPAEMKDSIRVALEHLAGLRLQPEPSGWLLIPADSPRIDSSVLDAILARWQSTSADILLPTYRGRRGHPVIFRWTLRTRVREIPSDRGLDWLVKDCGLSVEELPLEDPAVLEDLDTPEDYQRILQNRPQPE